MSQTVQLVTRAGAVIGEFSFEAVASGLPELIVLDAGYFVRQGTSRRYCEADAWLLKREAPAGAVGRPTSLQ